jgi:hypothetical protein
MTKKYQVIYLINNLKYMDVIRAYSLENLIDTIETFHKPDEIIMIKLLQDY